MREESVLFRNNIIYQINLQKQLACTLYNRDFAISQVTDSLACPDNETTGKVLDVVCNLPDNEVPANSCQSSVITSLPDFQSNKETICSTDRAKWVTGLTTPVAEETPCPRQADAERAMSEACSTVPSPQILGPGPSVTLTVTPPPDEGGIAPTAAQSGPANPPGALTL